MRKSFLILSVCVALMVSATVWAVADETQGILKGRIFDAETKEGLGGILIQVSGGGTSREARSNDFGYFIFRLKSGRYIAQLEQIEQRIGFEILPGKVALLSIPLKAAPFPKGESLPYSVNYAELQDRSNQDRPDKVSMEVPAAAPPSASAGEIPISRDPVKKSESGGEGPAERGKGAEISEPPADYPVKGAQSPEARVVHPGRRAPAVAVLEFKDSTGRGFGLPISEDLAQYLFDLGTYKVIGPDSVSATIGGQPADPLNAKFGQWISSRLGADVAIIGRIKSAEIEPQQYMFVMVMQAKISAVIHVIDTRTGNILANFTEDGTSGMSGTTSTKDRYFVEETTAKLFANAQHDLAKNIARRLSRAAGFLKEEPRP